MANSKIRALIATRLNPVAQEVLQEGGIDADVREDYTPEEFNEMIVDYHGLIVRSDPVNAESIAAAKNLKLIVRAGSGVNTIDIKAAAEKNILVMNTPDANSNAVAELVFGFMLAAARFLPIADSSVKKTEWRKKELMGIELSGKTIGIVGLGAIGSRIVPKAKSFDMKIIGYDPFLAPDRARELGIQVTSLEEVFRRSDFITFHVPLNSNTEGMITYDLMKMLPDGAMIINSARAQVIEKGALEKILEERPSLRAAADIYYEGDKPGEKSIAKFGDQVVLTPHLGASTKDANYRAARMSASEMVDFFNKGVISYPVNILDGPVGLDFKYMELAKKIGYMAYHTIAGSGQLSEIRITCYGELFDYRDILTKSAISGTMVDYLDELVTPTIAEKIAEEKGITIVKREPDDMKGHGDSITFDLVVKDKEKKTDLEVSVRGTITADGIPLIRRIDNFENIDIFPHGNLAVFIYEDRKGISGYIGDQMSKNDINIIDGRYKTSSDNLLAIAVLKTNQIVEDSLIDEISKHIKASKAFKVNFS